MSNTVKDDLLKTIIQNYPILPSVLVHRAGRDYCLSGSQRLRELKKKGVLYSYKNHEYDFSETPLLILYSLLNNGDNKCQK